MELKSKLFASAVAFTMVLSMVAVPASAQTTAELTAQINALLAQIAQLQAQIAGGSSSSATVTFTTDLTVGSKGAQVTALQQFLVAKGFLTMPAGVAMGYFGTLTKSALAAYQAANGISPAAGYFGPLTRAKVNAAGTTTGGTTTGGTSTGSITTPGAEGTLSVSESSSGIVSTVYEGDNMAPILGIKIEAKNSDMAVQRIKLDLDSSDGSDTKFYNRAYKKLYVTEGGNVLASTDLNSSTVVKDGTDYFVTIAGFNLIVPKGGSKTVVIKADAFEAIDTTDLALTFTLSLASNGIRAVDGAGIDQYAGSTSVSNAPDLAADLVDSAALKISANNSTPKKADIVCTAGSSENECDRVTVLVLDVKAEKDDVTITDLNVEIDETSGSAANVPTLYLYEGSTELDNAAVTDADDDYATFSDVDFVVPKDTTKTLTVKMDVRGATNVRTGYTAAASSTDFTTENSMGDSVTESGTATGNEIGVTNIGAEITLLSKSITTNGAPQVGGTNAPSTSTVSATFNVKVKALGGDILLGTAASTTLPFFEDTGASPSFTVYRNGAVDATISSVATSTAFTIPSTCTTNGTNSCLLSEGTEVTFPITVQFLGRTAAGTSLTNGLYAIQFALANVVANGTAQVVNFMNNEADWRTADVSFP